MAKSRRHHNADDIEAKLRQADGMAANGSTQKEISQALGVSIMTYHRWRRGRAERASEGSAALDRTAPAPAVLSIPTASRFSSPAGRPGLVVENERLRRLVANLLLEKVALQEQIEERSYPQRRRNS